MWGSGGGQQETTVPRLPHLPGGGKATVGLPGGPALQQPPVGTGCPPRARPQPAPETQTPAPATWPPPSPSQTSGLGVQRLTLSPRPWHERQALLLPCPRDGRFFLKSLILRGPGNHRPPTPADHHPPHPPTAPRLAFKAHPRPLLGEPASDYPTRHQLPSFQFLGTWRPPPARPHHLFPRLRLG